MGWAVGLLLSERRAYVMRGDALREEERRREGKDTERLWPSQDQYCTQHCNIDRVNTSACISDMWYWHS